jgi:hypothetical protein
MHVCWMHSATLPDTGESRRVQEALSKSNTN